MRHTSNTNYSRLPAPFPQGRAVGDLRVDGSGAVRCEEHNDSDASSDDERDMKSQQNSSQLSNGNNHRFTPDTNNPDFLGESAAHALGLKFTLTPFLRPKILAPGVRCAPTPHGNGTIVGFFDEGKMILFGGNEQVKANNETWVYAIPEKKWSFLNSLELVSEEWTALRKAKGLTGDRVPPPRCGHSAVAVRDVRDPTKLDPVSLKSVPADVTNIDEIRKGYRMDRRGSGVGGEADHTRRARALSVAKAHAISNFSAESVLDASTFDESGDDVLAHRNISALGITPMPKSAGGREVANLTIEDLSFNSVSSASQHAKRHNGGWGYDPCMIVFGGADLSRGQYYNDLWLFDVEALAWKEIKAGGSAPCERWHHVACVLEQRMFIYGGESSEFEVLGDLHMYDHLVGTWRAIRLVEPIPPGRMLHSAAVVGDHMVVVGGVGSKSNNASLVDIAVSQGVHLTSSKAALRRNTRRSTLTGGNAGMSQEEREKANALQDELSDVWVLNMRTLVWREVAKANKECGPFLLREDLRVNGQMLCSEGSSTGPKLSGKYGYRCQYKSLEGHSAVSFNERVLVLGGKLNGKANRRVFALHLPTETWAFLGELPTGQSDDAVPCVRFAQSACTLVERRSISAMRDAVSLQQLEAAHRRLGEDAECGPFIDKVLRQLASQISFSGVLSVYHLRPMVSNTVTAYLYGGFGFPKTFSELWRFELSDHNNIATRQFEEIFGSSLERLLSNATMAIGLRAAIGDTHASSLIRQRQLGDGVHDEDEELCQDEMELVEEYLLGGGGSQESNTRKGSQATGGSKKPFSPGAEGSARLGAGQQVAARRGSKHTSLSAESLSFPPAKR